MGAYFKANGANMQKNFKTYLNDQFLNGTKLRCKYHSLAWFDAVSQAEGWALTSTKKLLFSFSFFNKKI
jgi:hypothetical protein